MALIEARFPFQTSIANFMSKTINLFMWPYQPHFRFEIQYRARRVLELIAPGLQVSALLVGVRAPGANKAHPVCVEPEDGDWDPTLFFGCEARADTIYETHPDHSIFYGDEPSMRDLPENIRKSSVRQAVEEVLATYDKDHKTVSLCGRPTRVDGYHVVPVLQFDASQFAQHPRLPSRLELDRFSAPVGFLESTIDRLLEEASAALAMPEPGRALRSAREDANSVLRAAGDRFLWNVSLAIGDLMLQGIFDALNVISSLRYEGTTAAGEIIFAPAAAADVHIRVRLKEPVELHHHKLARKLIETSGTGLSCVCHGSAGIVGLGQSNDPQAEKTFRVSFSGHYRWELLHKGQTLMQVAFGIPRLPTIRLPQSLFRSNARRVFDGIPDDKLTTLWSIVEAAIDQKHGTMIVFSAAAAAEAARLAKEAVVIEPVHLTQDLVRKLTSIDGALLVDTDGVCHAIGVILDGLATPEGDASRGARYNSAIRYLYSAETPTMCLVVSEDGYVNIFPELRPQIRRSEVQQWVDKLRVQDIGTYAKTRSWLDDHRFYLSSEQCEVVNQELARIHAAPQELGEIRLVMSPFTPHPGMNDSYYLPETGT